MGNFTSQDMWTFGLYGHSGKTKNLFQHYNKQRRTRVFLPLMGIIERIIWVQNLNLNKTWTWVLLLLNPRDARTQNVDQVH